MNLTVEAGGAAHPLFSDHSVDLQAFVGSLARMADEPGALAAVVATPEGQAQATCNKCGVEVQSLPLGKHSEPFALNFPDVPLSVAGEGEGEGEAEVLLPVHLSAQPQPALLVAVHTAPWSDVFCLDGALSRAGDVRVSCHAQLPLPVTPRSGAVTLSYRPARESGTYACWAFFVFERHTGGVCDRQTHRFVVARKLVVRESSSAPPADHRGELRALAPQFVPQAVLSSFDEPLACQQLPTALPGSQEWQSRLPRALSPSSQMHGEALVVLRALAKGPVPTPELHRLRLKALVQLEACQTAADLRRYDLHSVHIKGRRQIRVPGAPENRPMLRFGDVVRLRTVRAQPRYEVEAQVLEVREQVVQLRVPDAFALHDRYHVRFELDTLPFQAMLCGVARCLTSILAPPAPPSAPSSGPEGSERSEERWQWFDDRLNREQQRAVRSVVERRSGSAPFVIIGPAGTGKTVTLREAILQVLARNPDALILVSAPSDPAADVLALGLADAGLGPEQMLRVNYLKRAIASVKPALLAYCPQEPLTNVFVPPSAAQLARCSVIVTTCCTAGFLPPPGRGVRPFDHIFVDECSQAFEAEALVPLSLATPRTHITLSGDPRQLGPTVRSPEGRDFGMGVSLQERLMQLPHYAARGSPLVVQLRRNYRNHSAILATPSELFYGGSLQACADPRVVDSLCDWGELQGGFPVLFYGVNGAHSHDWDSPSYANAVEATRIVALIKALLYAKEVDVGTGDITVLAPFRRQVLLLRKLLRSENLNAVNVGSVDDLQGSESKVIFVSPTLSALPSSPSLPSLPSPSSEDDLRLLDFVGNEKRFNVAVTRAQALLVVVGSPALLVRNPCWQALLGHCVRNNGYRGVACSELGVYEDTDEALAEEQLLEALKTMPLLGRGDADRQFPGTVAAHYSEEQAFRVML